MARAPFSVKVCEVSETGLPKYVESHTPDGRIHTVRTQKYGTRLLVMTCRINGLGFRV